MLVALFSSFAIKNRPFSGLGRDSSLEHRLCTQEVQVLILALRDSLSTELGVRPEWPKHQKGENFFPS